MNLGSAVPPTLFPAMHRSLARFGREGGVCLAKATGGLQQRRTDLILALHLAPGYPSPDGVVCGRRTIALALDRVYV